jgi:hypothetical protein
LINQRLELDWASPHLRDKTFETHQFLLHGIDAGELPKQVILNLPLLAVVAGRHGPHHVSYL